MFSKYPTYFLVVMAVYVFTLVIGLNFIFVAISVGLAGFEFALLGIMTLLPLVLLALYTVSSRFLVLWGKETVMRFVITIIVLIDSILAIFFLLPAML